MGNPEQNFIYKSGERIRNVSFIGAIAAVAVSASSVLFPLLGLVVSGEILRRVSKKNG